MGKETKYKPIHINKKRKKNTHEISGYLYYIQSLTIPAQDFLKSCYDGFHCSVLLKLPNSSPITCADSDT